MNLDASRRRFLQSAAGLGGGLALGAQTPSVPPLPTVKFGGADVTRLIVGSNPLYGYSHFNSLLDRTMREWMTQDRRMELLHRCEQSGINTWQLHYMKQSIEDFKRYRAEGGKMNWFLLGDFEMMTDLKLIGEVAKTLKPIGIAHHGNRTDDRFRNGEMHKVKEFCKAVRDAGVMVGISTHNPAVVDSVEGEGWDIDYYMTCMYRVSRTPEEARREYGESSIGEIYMEKDPERMCRMVRQTKRPCLAFKLLGAGRQTSPKQLEAAYRYVLGQIKPTDACIVGMFPKYSDQARENADLFRKILTTTT